VKTTLLTTASAGAHRLPAQCEPLWRYQDLAPVLPAAPLDNLDEEDEALQERPSPRWLLRCQLIAPARSVR
jgi:hypothetical protein